MDFFILFFCGTCVLTIYVLDYKYGSVTIQDVKRWWHRRTHQNDWDE